MLKYDIVKQHTKFKALQWVRREMYIVDSCLKLGISESQRTPKSSEALYQNTVPGLSCCPEHPKHPGPLLNLLPPETRLVLSSAPRARLLVVVHCHPRRLVRGVLNPVRKVIIKLL